MYLVWNAGLLRLELFFVVLVFCLFHIYIYIYSCCFFVLVFFFFFFVVVFSCFLRCFLFFFWFLGGKQSLNKGLLVTEEDLGLQEKVLLPGFRGIRYFYSFLVINFSIWRGRSARFVASRSCYHQHVSMAVCLLKEAMRDGLLV